MSWPRVNIFPRLAPNLVDYSEDSRRPVRAETAGKRRVEKMASPCCPDGNTEEADRPSRELRERYPNYAGGQAWDHGCATVNFVYWTAAQAVLPWEQSRCPRVRRRL
jgi:hypothetical protein